MHYYITTSTTKEILTKSGSYVGISEIWDCANFAAHLASGFQNLGVSVFSYLLLSHKSPYNKIAMFRLPEDFIMKNKVSF